MLTSQEEKFLVYWKTNRDRDKKLMRQLLIGLPFGLLLSAGILFSLDMDWYTRANMIANTQLNPFVLLLALAGIAIFMAIFYKKHQWDMREQRYRELLHKKESEKNYSIKNDAAK